MQSVAMKNVDEGLVKELDQVIAGGVAFRHAQKKLSKELEKSPLKMSMADFEVLRQQQRAYYNPDETTEGDQRAEELG